MIRANELRINNLVKVKISNDSRFYRVTAISGIEGFVYLDDVRDGEIIPIEKLKPIPLTEDILVKCGGKVNPFNIGIDYSRFGVIWKESYKYWYVIDNVTETYMTKIEWVHEWQNFVHAMDGKELEVKL